MLSALPLPGAITVEMIQPLRDTPFTAPIEQLLATRAVDQSVRTFTGPGSELTISVFTPRSRSRRGAGIFYLHGGGMIIGDRFTGVEHLLDWVEEHQAVGLPREYRLAPENPDPAPVEDGFDDRDNTVSTHQYSRTGSWSRESNVTGWTALLGERRSTDSSSLGCRTRST